MCLNLYFLYDYYLCDWNLKVQQYSMLNTWVNSNGKTSFLKDKGELLLQAKTDIVVSNILMNTLA